MTGWHAYTTIAVVTERAIRRQLLAVRMASKRIVWGSARQALLLAEFRFKHAVYKSLTCSVVKSLGWSLFVVVCRPWWIC